MKRASLVAPLLDEHPPDPDSGGKAAHASDPRASAPASPVPGAHSQPRHQPPYRGLTHIRGRRRVESSAAPRRRAAWDPWARLTWARLPWSKSCRFHSRCCLTGPTQMPPPHAPPAGHGRSMRSKGVRVMDLCPGMPHATVALSVARFSSLRHIQGGSPFAPSHRPAPLPAQASPGPSFAAW